MTTYYVATSGSNSGNGSSSSPWKTISKAMQANLKPGDEVIVRAGTYHESVRISKSGNAGDYITIKSEKPGAAKIVATDSYGVHIQGDYVKLDGFDVSNAKAAGITANLVHHVEITDNNVHDNQRHGISVNRSEFVTIEGNVTHDNASAGFYSGISVFHPENVTGDHSSKGFRIIVRGNISYDNVTKTGPHSDGNGIILDDFRGTKNGTPYLYASLVENNLVYSNGGKGIQIAWTDYVTVRNNTAWQNNVDSKKTGTWHGELSNMNSSHNTWVNNIAVTDPDISGYNTAIDNTSFSGYTNSDNIWKNNLTYNGTSGDELGAHDRVERNAQGVRWQPARGKSELHFGAQQFRAVERLAGDRRRHQGLRLLRGQPRQRHPGRGDRHRRLRGERHHGQVEHLDLGLGLGRCQHVGQHLDGRRVERHDGEQDRHREGRRPDRHQRRRHPERPWWQRHPERRRRQGRAPWRCRSRQAQRRRGCRHPARWGGQGHPRRRRRRRHLPVQDGGGSGGRSESAVSPTRRATRSTSATSTPISASRAIRPSHTSGPRRSPAMRASCAMRTGTSTATPTATRLPISPSTSRTTTP
ncbi:MAG: right-handed parallel beta-helix repeat-containing protein [Amaricoccus sp.]